MMNDWRDRIGDLVGTEVEILVGEERILAAVRSIEVMNGRGATYTLAGMHKGWQVAATATQLTRQGDGQPYRAEGDVKVWLSSQEGA